jgi:Domain of unknown function (DUF4105)
MKNIVLVLFMFISIAANCQKRQLSPLSQISIITCGPYQGELYSAFGHTAIRVFDGNDGLNVVYNYGVFDFDQPNFYLNYTRGLLYFKLGVMSYIDFRNYYMYYNRSVVEQVLDLTPAQRQAIFDYLEWNALPENDTYRYDYFFNNCSSKVRDVFAQVLGDAIKFDSSHITTDYTIRQITDLCLKQQPWGDLGIDICLGLPMDKKATPNEYMFLPEYLEAGFDHATINKNGEVVPIVQFKKPVYMPVPQEEPKSIVHPWVVFGIFFALAIGLCVYDLRRKKISKWFDLLVFGSTGLVGLLLVVLWTATDHQAAAKNFNILWALPTNLFVVAIFRERSANFLRKYFSVATLIWTLLLISWFFLPQQLHIFLLPFVAALLFRAFTLTRLL